MKPRKEVYTRNTFALEMAEKWFKAMKHSLIGGNIVSCRATLKFLQARRIYIHYQHEFQKSQNLPLTKY